MQARAVSADRRVRRYEVSPPELVVGRVPGVGPGVVLAAGAAAVLEVAVVAVREVGGWAPQVFASVPNAGSGCLINQEHRAWSSGARTAE